MNTEKVIEEIRQIPDSNADAHKELVALYEAVHDKIVTIAIQNEIETYLTDGGIDVNSYGSAYGWQESEGTWDNYWSSSSYGC